MFTSGAEYIGNHSFASNYCLVRAYDAIDLMRDMRHAMAQPANDRHGFSLYGHFIGECDGEWALFPRGADEAPYFGLTLQMVVAWLLATNW